MESVDEECIDQLLQRGYRYALSLTHDRSAAEDLVQDACFSISRRGGPWNIQYLITAIRNKHIDSVRRAARVTIYPIDEIERIVDSDLYMPSFDVQLEGALAELSTEDRELLYLSVVEAYTARELAEITKQPRGTILSKLHRAKKQLRRLLAPYRSEENHE